MSTFYQYEYPADLISDLQDQKKIFFEKGMIANVTVAAKPSNEDGFVMIYAYNYNAIFQNVNRYSYTLTQFRQLTFSQESLGLYYYMTIDPQNHILTNWTETGALTDGQKSEYMTAAYNMLRKNFVPKWDLNWNLQVTPAPIIKVETVGGINISNGASWVLPDLVTGESGTVTFLIKNIGTSRLDVIESSVGVLNGLEAGESVNITNVNDSLNPNVGEIEITLTYTLVEQGPKEISIFIESNDPLQSIFSFNVELDVQATPMAQIELVNTVYDAEYLVFDRDSSSELDGNRIVRKYIKNTGNAPLIINSITAPILEMATDEYNIVNIVYSPDQIEPNEIREITLEFFLPTIGIINNTNFSDDLDDYLTTNSSEVNLNQEETIIVDTNAGILSFPFIVFYYLFYSS
jgi:archaellum component FlaG (FlaF/FlaG flagellin family)